MNPLSQFKNIRILPLLIASALVALAALTAVPARATPPCCVTTEFIAGSATAGIRFADEIDVRVRTGEWRIRIDTNGASDGFVVRNTFAPGGNTGWHSHPGPSLIFVTQGTITDYESDHESDHPTCTPHVYTAGSAFIDHGGEHHVHLLRNESTTDPAVTVAVQIVPPGAARRIDQPQPANCPAFPCPSPCP